MEKIRKRFLSSLVGEPGNNECTVEDFKDSFDYVCCRLSSDESALLKEYYMEGKNSKDLALEKGTSDLGIRLDLRRVLNKIRNKKEYGVYYADFFTKGYNVTLNKIEESKKKLEEAIGRDASDLSSITLNELDLSTRTYNQLRRAGYYSLIDFVGISIEDISNIRNLGVVSQKEILDKLKEFGISLK